MKSHALLLIYVCGLIVTCCSCFYAPGAQNLVQNGSFESISLSPWTSSGTGLLSGFGDAADGGNFANIGGFLYQDLATTPGQSYHLRYAMAGNINWPGLIRMDTLWGGSVVAETLWDPAGHNINNLGWIFTDLDVVASSSQTRLMFQNIGQVNQRPFLDAVSVVVVPEPSSLMLIGLGGFMVCRCMR